MSAGVLAILVLLASCDRDGGPAPSPRTGADAGARPPAPELERTMRACVILHLRLALHWQRSGPPPTRDELGVGAGCAALDGWPDRRATAEADRLVPRWSAALARIARAGSLPETAAPDVEAAAIAEALAPLRGELQADAPAHYAAALSAIAGEITARSRGYALIGLAVLFALTDPSLTPYDGMLACTALPHDDHPAYDRFDERVRAACASLAPHDVAAAITLFAAIWVPG